MVGVDFQADWPFDAGDWGAAFFAVLPHAQQQGFASDLSLLYPADIAGSGVYALIGYQEISGLYRADALGYMINTLQWQNGRFALTNQMLGVLGTQA